MTYASFQTLWQMTVSHGQSTGWPEGSTDLFTHRPEAYSSDSGGCVDRCTWLWLHLNLYDFTWPNLQPGLWRSRGGAYFWTVDQSCPLYTHPHRTPAACKNEYLDGEASGLLSGRCASTLSAKRSTASTSTSIQKIKICLASPKAQRTTFKLTVSKLACRRQDLECVYIFWVYKTDGSIWTLWI